MTAAQCAAIIAPLAALQFYGYLRFCSRQPSGDVPAWCAERVPYIYGYVQSHYWGVGFLNYWQLSQASSHTPGCQFATAIDRESVHLSRRYVMRQVPNFVLAAPALALSCYGCFAYFNADWTRALSLGLFTGVRDSLVSLLPVHECHAWARTTTICHS